VGKRKYYLHTELFSAIIRQHFSLGFSMILPDYIAAIGIPKIAEVCNVSEHTARNWRELRTVPEPARAAELIEWSRGALSWDGIYSPFFKKA